jgi:hypothetical protein
MPPAIHNDVFGRLEWDDQLGCWLGGIDWPAGRYTEVAIWHPGDDVIAGLRQAQAGLGWLESNEEHARRCVAWEMVEVYNTDWLEGFEPITTDDLASQIELVAIAFLDDGSLLLSYDAGELFGEHVIDGEFSPDRSFLGAALAD